MVSFNFCGWFAGLVAVMGSALPTYTFGSKDTAIKAIHMVYQKSQEGAARNCTPGSEDTVQLRYDEKRWLNTARSAVFVANLVTSVLAVMEEEGVRGANVSKRFDPRFGPLDDQWLYGIVRNTVETDRDVIGSGICFGEYQYKNYKNFCPYASESERGAQVAVKDLSIPNYFYTDERTEAEWWHGPRLKLEGRVEWPLSHLKISGNHSLPNPIVDGFPVVVANDGYWTKPYYDCGGAYRWMITYLAPFLAQVAHHSNIYHYIGVTSVDIDLSSIDINQCDATFPDNTTSTEEFGVDALIDQFRGSHRCNTDSTLCQFIPGYGFRRGSYACVCKPGWYFDQALKQDEIGIEVDGSWGFNGSFLEKEYDKADATTVSLSKFYNRFSCLQCAPGCDECADDSPCLFSPEYGLRGGTLSLSVIIILLILVMGTFVIRYRGKHIVYAASIPCLMLLLAGLLISCGALYAGFFEASSLSCLFQRWMFHIGTVLANGALFLPVYRTAVIYEASQRKKLAVPKPQISYKQLLSGLFTLVTLVVIYLAVWTGMDLPITEELKYGSLKVLVCRNSYFVFPMYCIQGIVLAWGCYYGFKIRSIHAPFNENKRLFLTICNITGMTLLSLSLTRVLTLLNTNPDHIFVLDCAFAYGNHCLVLGLVYGTKVYAVVRGKADEEYRKNRVRRLSQQSGNFLTTAAPAGYFSEKAPSSQQVPQAGCYTCGTSSDISKTFSGDHSSRVTLSPHIEQEELEETHSFHECEKQEEATVCEKPEQATVCEKSKKATLCEKLEGAMVCEKPEGATVCEKPEEVTACEKSEEATVCEKPEEATVCEKLEEATANQDMPVIVAEQSEPSTLPDVCSMGDNDSDNKALAEMNITDTDGESMEVRKSRDLGYNIPTMKCKGSLGMMEPLERRGSTSLALRILRRDSKPEPFSRGRSSSTGTVQSLMRRTSDSYGSGSVYTAENSPSHRRISFPQNDSGVNSNTTLDECPYPLSDAEEQEKQEDFNSTLVSYPRALEGVEEHEMEGQFQAEVEQPEVTLLKSDIADIEAIVSHLNKEAGSHQFAVDENTSTHGNNFQA